MAKKNTTTAAKNTATKTVAGEFKTVALDQAAAQPMVVINTAPVTASAVEMIPAPQEEHEVMRLGDELIAVAMDDLGSSLEAALSRTKGELGRADARIKDIRKQIETRAAAADTSSLLASCNAAAKALNEIGGSVTTSVTLGEPDLEKRVIPVTAKLVQNARNDDNGRGRYSSASDSMSLELNPIRFDTTLAGLADELAAAIEHARAIRDQLSKLDDEIRNMGRYEKKMRADLGRLRLEQTTGGQTLLATFSARTQAAVSERLGNVGLDIKQLGSKS